MRMYSRKAPCQTSNNKSTMSYYFDDYDDYGHSYEQYGGYNGWDDDTINDAFEGDPEATWNVD